MSNLTNNTSMRTFKAFLWAVAGAALAPAAALAQSGGSGPGGGGASGGSGAGTGGCSATFCLTNPFRVGNTLYEFIVTVIQDILMPIGGVIVVVFIIYSGFMFVTARGNPAKLTAARTGFLYVVIGSAILLGAWVIATVVQNTVNSLKATP